MDYSGRINVDKENISSLTRQMENTFADPVVFSVITGIILILIIVKYIFGGFSVVLRSIFTYFAQLFTTISTMDIKSKFVDETGSFNYINLFVIVVALAVVAFFFAGIGLYAERVRNYGNNEVVPIHLGKSEFSNRIERKSGVISPSENKPNGSEFSYTMFVYIKNLPSPASNSANFILLRKGTGNPEIPSTRTTSSIHCPTISITPGGQMKFYVTTMQTATTATESFTLDNIPIQRAFHLIVSLAGRNLDVFIDGVLASRFRLNGIPQFNNELLSICPSTAGYEGEYGNIIYFRKYLSSDEIDRYSDLNISLGLTSVTPCS
jgi:hypothetical protein